MIIVTGSVTAKADSFSDLLRESQAHVARSRLEDGCIHHSVHVDCENPLRLFFFEQWRDITALHKHFGQPGSHTLIAAVKQYAADSTGVQTYAVMEPAAKE